MQSLKNINENPRISQILIEGYRQLPVYQKLKQVNDLTIAVQKLAAARINRQYGKISEREMRLRLASLWLSRDIMIKVFNWDPQEKGY